MDSKNVILFFTDLLIFPYSMMSLLLSLLLLTLLLLLSLLYFSVLLNCTTRFVKIFHLSSFSWIHWNLDLVPRSAEFSIWAAWRIYGNRTCGATSGQCQSCQFVLYVFHKFVCSYTESSPYGPVCLHSETFKNIQSPLLTLPLFTLPLPLILARALPPPRLWRLGLRQLFLSLFTLPSMF